MSDKEGSLFKKHQEKLGDGLLNPTEVKPISTPQSVPTRTVGTEPPFQPIYRSQPAHTEADDTPSLPLVIFDSIIASAEAVTEPLHPVVAVPDLILQSPSFTWIPAVMLKGALKGSMSHELQEVYNNPNTRRGLGLLTWSIIVGDALWREQVIQSIAPYMQQISILIEQTLN